MQTAVCAIAKLENNYIREWVEYYLNLGFDKIILYDNNELDGEDLSSPLSDYIKSGKIDIINAKGKKGYQVEAYDDCYQKYKEKVDWILFADIDEFLFIENNIKINDFISQEQFNNFNVICFLWCTYNDNNYITVKDNNYNVLSRFNERAYPGVYDRYHKIMVKTNIPNLRINSVHKIWAIAPAVETDSGISNTKEVLDSIKYCDSNGKELDLTNIDIKTKQAACLNHFKYKTLQEYLELKIKRGYPMPFLDYGMKLNLTGFFLVNKLTKSKIEFAKEWLEKSDLPEDRKTFLLNELKYLLKSGIPFYDE